MKGAARSAAPFLLSLILMADEEERRSEGAARSAAPFLSSLIIMTDEEWWREGGGAKRRPLPLISHHHHGG